MTKEKSTFKRKRSWLEVCFEVSLNVALTLWVATVVVMIITLVVLVLQGLAYYFL